MTAKWEHLYTQLRVENKKGLTLFKSGLKFGLDAESHEKFEGLGKDGWELVAVHTVPGEVAGETPFLMAFWKRPAK